MCKLQFLSDPISACCQAAQGRVVKGTLTYERLSGYKHFIKCLHELPIFQSVQDGFKILQFLSLGSIVSWLVCDTESGNVTQM